MALLSGLAVLIVYYNLVYSPTRGFEKFMNSQGFGVRLLFAFIGIVTSLLWLSMSKGEAPSETTHQLESVLTSGRHRIYASIQQPRPALHKGPGLNTPP